MGIGHSVSWLDWSITIFGILSLLDMVLRCLCYNYIFLSGLLVISTMTNIKIKLVDGKSFLFSSRIITYVKIFDTSNMRKIKKFNFQSIVNGIE